MERKTHFCGNCGNANSPSLCAACVNRNLKDKYELLNAAKRERDLLHKRLDQKLKANREAVEQQNWRLTHGEKIDHLKETLRLKQNQLCQTKCEVEDKTNELNTKMKKLAEASVALKGKKAKELKLHSEQIHAQSSALTALQAELLQNQSVAIKQLCKIFPLEHAHKPKDGKNRDEGSSREYSWCDQICNVPLPRGLNPNSVTPQQLGVSLGYMVQLLNLVARYLHVPLLLHSGFAGSCSRVCQKTPHSHDSQIRKHEQEYYPLFFPNRKNNSTHASKECSGVLDVAASVLNFDQKAMAEDVQKGIHLLKRAVGCVTTYFFNLFSIPLPTGVSTFEAFQKILEFIASRDKDAAAFLKETKLRCERKRLLLESSSDREIVSSRLQESELCKDEKSIIVGRGDGASRNEMSEMMRKAKDDAEWEVVEDLLLPPRPSQSEDVEQWIMALHPDRKRQ